MYGTLSSIKRLVFIYLLAYDAVGWAAGRASTSFGWGKGGNVTSATWQVTLCDPTWHVSSRSSVATLRTAIHLLLKDMRPVKN